MIKTDNVDISFIIVNYNTTDLLIESVRSIINKTKSPLYEIIVVDNASPDNGAKKIRQELQDKIQLIVSEKNLGFGGANNLGLAKAKGKYILFLNPDTVLLNDASYIFKNYMDTHKEQRVGAIGCILLDTHMKPSNSYGFFLTSKNIIFTALKLNKKEKYKNIITPIDVDFVTGAALFVPRKVLDDIGHFDEQFFMYCEEVDLEKRMADNGYKRIVIPGPQIIHYDGASFSSKNKRSAHRRKMYDYSKMVYIRKHYSNKKYFLFRLLFLIFRIPAYFNYHYTVYENLSYFMMIVKPNIKR